MNCGYFDVFLTVIIVFDSNSGIMSRSNATRLTFLERFKPITISLKKKIQKNKINTKICMHIIFFSSILCNRRTRKTHILSFPGHKKMKASNLCTVRLIWAGNTPLVYSDLKLLFLLRRRYLSISKEKT